MTIKEQCIRATTELCEIAGLTAGNVFVVGCSTSEVVGAKIGTNSDTDVAKEIFEGIYSVLSQRGIFMAVQCCEHLNRAIVIERKSGAPDEVNVVPQKKAGGSLATCAYNSFEDPMVVEEIKADCGIDIGNTLIGMHLKKVAVPVRLSLDKIGQAPIVCARVRPKFIGGARAIYDESKM
ncbi:MAG: TIGR01440 family protein [Clostridia bacterium]|nr:TIGR01440 family protein [Clostridia bacterium]